MKNKKGFTLIELLAAIVLLAIIALIAVPIVLNLIKDSKKSSAVRSAEIYLEAAETFIVSDQLNNALNIDFSSNDTVTIKVKDLKKYGLKFKGNVPNDYAELTVTKNGIVDINKFYIDNYQISMDKNSKELYATRIDDIEKLYFSLKTLKYNLYLNSNQNHIGIRWDTDIDIDLINKLKKYGVEIKLGTIILPLDYINNGDEFTKDVSDKILSVEYDLSKDFFNADDLYFFTGAIIITNESTYNRNIVGRGYATITYKGKSITYYADYIDNDINKNSISLSKLCYDFKNNNIDQYSNLSSTLKEKVDKASDLYK